MNGDLDFTASLKERVALLNGVTADVFEKLKSVLKIAKGARELCRALKTLGYKIAVLSGGFQPLAEWLAEQLGIDIAVANHVSLPIPSDFHFSSYLSSHLTIHAARNRRGYPDPNRKAGTILPYRRRRAKAHSSQVHRRRTWHPPLANHGRWRWRQ
jgi:phosphoglycolate phosphatase-like HAD superfamily hydrolase